MLELKISLVIIGLIFIGFISIFLFFKYKITAFKKYFNSQKEIIDKLLALENRKGKLLEDSFFSFQEWIVSEQFKTFILTTLLVTPEIDAITKNSATGIKRLLEALEPYVEVIQTRLNKEIENNFDSVRDKLRKEIEEEICVNED